MTMGRYLGDRIGVKPSSHGSTPNFKGTWTNRLGSEMKLTVRKNDVTGKYRTGVGQPNPEEEFPLKGFVSGDLIVFCVNFGSHASMTSWAGQHTRDENDEEVIYTLWHLARNVPDEKEPDNLWAAILAGANEYRRK